MKITATIQARMGSGRLPGKVLKKIAGKTILEWLISRLKKSTLIDEIVVATTFSKNDLMIKEISNNMNIQCWRGSESDVLERVHDAFNSTNSHIHVEFYGDSPFIDYKIVDRYLNYFKENFNEIDYLTNSIKTSYPPGSEFSIYKAECSKYAQKYTSKSDRLREHVGQNIINKKKYKIKNIEAEGIYNQPNLYIEIDTIEDFKMLNKLIPKVILEYGEDFSLKDIILVSMKEKKLCELNSNVKRRWREYRDD